MFSHVQSPQWLFLPPGPMAPQRISRDCVSGVSFFVLSIEPPFGRQRETERTRKENEKEEEEEKESGRELD